MAGTTPDWNPNSWAPGPNGSWQPPDYAARATGQIDGSEIASITVDQLTAGKLRSAVILGGSIKTALTGARVEMDASGIRLYDAGNVLKVNLDAVTGNGTFTGTVSASTITGATITGGTITGTTISGGTITGGAISGGTITGGAISGGTITGATVTGGVIQTAASGSRVVLSNGFVNQILGYSGDAGELSPNHILMSNNNVPHQDFINIGTGDFTGSANDRASMTLTGSDATGATRPVIEFACSSGQVVIFNDTSLRLVDISTVPTIWGTLYAEAGALKWRGGAGTLTTIAPA